MYLHCVIITETQLIINYFLFRCCIYFIIVVILYFNILLLLCLLVCFCKGHPLYTPHWVLSGLGHLLLLYYCTVGPVRVGHVVFMCVCFIGEGYVHNCIEACRLCLLKQILLFYSCGSDLCCNIADLRIHCSYSIDYLCTIL